MAELRVTGLHVCRLPQLQVPAVAGWPNGTDDLAPPSARAAALGALGSTGWEREERTRMQREREPEGGGMHKGGKEGEGARESMSDPRTGPCAAASQRPRVQVWAAGMWREASTHETPGAYVPGLVIKDRTVIMHTGLNERWLVLEGACCGMEQRPLVTPASDAPLPDSRTAADRAL